MNLPRMFAVRRLAIGTRFKRSAVDARLAICRWHHSATSGGLVVTSPPSSATSRINSSSSTIADAAFCLNRISFALNSCSTCAR